MNMQQSSNSIYVSTNLYLSSTLSPPPPPPTPSSLTATCGTVSQAGWMLDPTREQKGVVWGVEDYRYGGRSEIRLLVNNIEKCRVEKKKDTGFFFKRKKLNK